MAADVLRSDGEYGDAFMELFSVATRAEEGPRCNPTFKMPDGGRGYVLNRGPSSGWRSHSSAAEA